MFAIHKPILGLVIGLIFLGTEVVAEAPREILKEIKLQGLDSETCKYSPTLLTELIKQADNSSDIVEIAAALSFLELQWTWESENHDQSKAALIRIGQKDPSYELLAAKALASADGELKYALSIFDKDRKISIIQSIINNNKQNPSYQTLARIALADIYQESALNSIKGRSIPLTSDQANENIIIEIRQAIELYSIISSFLTNSFQSGGTYTRDIGLDFTYQIALLKYVIGDDQWHDDLVPILTTYNSIDPYSGAEMFDHIYVNSFLRSPIVTIPTPRKKTNDESSCTPISVNHKISTTHGRVLVKRFFNPVLLSLHSCAAMSKPDSYDSLSDFTQTLLKYENYDYRVILGHFRGDKIRFSDLTKDKLIAAFNDTFPDIQDRLKFSNDVAIVPVCNGIDASSIIIRSLEFGEQATGKSLGYFYFGEGLTFDEAKIVKSLLVSEKLFRESYILRPEIR